jgi:hypothetical protein
MLLPPELGRVLQAWLAASDQLSWSAQGGIYALCLCGKTG